MGEGAADGPHARGTRLLEISSRSTSALGQRLSAMNLEPATGRSSTVEAAYQGAKDYGDGGSDAIRHAKNGFDAKRAAKDREATKKEGLTGFEHDGTEWRPNREPTSTTGCGPRPP